jgi:hypothetical protein
MTRQAWIILAVVVALVLLVLFAIPTTRCALTGGTMLDNGMYQVCV